MDMQYKYIPFDFLKLIHLFIFMVTLVKEIR